ncbi:unnamed protein product [Danaus chrysippus]|uniref:(African queen) hypothetical protein n=1 Tax=Danaus chrysippus TaxID=151541 RepID=A0A8J2R4M8_9NEOP|nr:unnamed protein product [Danaus chrysippus]
MASTGQVADNASIQRRAYAQEILMVDTICSVMLHCTGFTVCTTCYVRSGIDNYRRLQNDRCASKKAAIPSKPGVEPRKKSIPLLLTTQVYPNKIKLRHKLTLHLRGGARFTKANFKVRTSGYEQTIKIKGAGGGGGRGGGGFVSKKLNRASEAAATSQKSILLTPCPMEGEKWTRVKMPPAHRGELAACRVQWAVFEARGLRGGRGERRGARARIRCKQLEKQAPITPFTETL